jgi:asparagine synthase (glutamine-hydrolysing)
MPGIIGLITKISPEQAKRELLQMVEALRHESFYAAGTWIDESLGVYVGWVARKGSFSDGMPLRNEGGDRVLIFSGEEFPEPGTAERLKGLGHDVEISGPSYLVHAAEEDSTFPTGLNGRFHGLLVDRHHGTAMLFNDRYGMHRIYYHESQDAFYFASEAKAILSVRPKLRAIDAEALGEFLSCGAVLENRTLFQATQVLPPASAWKFQNGTLDSKRTYFQVKDWEEQEILDQESFYRNLRESFTRNLPRYFGGTEKIGMSLTGGLDTRMIMAWQQFEPGRLPCYTFGGMHRECKDVTTARQVARACGQPHQVIPVSEEFLAHFPQYAERTVFLTEGCVDVSRSPDLYLNERARQIAPVRMTGNYGGEILRQVRGFKPVVPLEGLFDSGLLPYIRKAEATYARNLAGHPVSFAAFKQGPWYHYGSLALEETQLSLRSPYLDNDFVRTVLSAPKSVLANNNVSLRLVADGNPALLGIPTDRGVGKQNGLGGTLSRAFLEFQFKAEYAYDIGMPQWVARIDHKFSAFHLERLFLGRHKVFHFRIWYRGALASYLQEMLLDRRSLSRPYVNGKAVECIVRGHLKGERNYTTEIHKLLTLELLHRRFLDGSESNNPRSAAVPVVATARQ